MVVPSRGEGEARPFYHSGQVKAARKRSTDSLVPTFGLGMQAPPWWDSNPTRSVGPVRSHAERGNELLLPGEPAATGRGADGDDGRAVELGATHDGLAGAE